MNIRKIIREEVQKILLKEGLGTKTYVVDTSQEALEDEMYDAQGEVQMFLRPAIDDDPEETYEDLFGDYKHPEILAISDITSPGQIEGFKMMISRQGKYGLDTVKSLKNAMKKGKPIPPVTIKKDWNDSFSLISGRHRILAALELGLTHVPVLKMYIRNEGN
jgi:hypothetical protein